MVIQQEYTYRCDAGHEYGYQDCGIVMPCQQGVRRTEENKWSLRPKYRDAPNIRVVNCMEPAIRLGAEDYDEALRQLKEYLAYMREHGAPSLEDEHGLSR